MSGRCLFLVNGLGLGNSTRCHAIIQRLQGTGLDIEVATSGNGLWYFTNHGAGISAIHKMSALRYGSKGVNLSIWRTALTLPQLWQVHQENNRTLDALLAVRRPDIVVTDSVYDVAPVKRRRIPIVALNNSDVVHELYYKERSTPPSIRAQFFCVEESDYLFHRLMPDIVLSPSIDANLNAPAGRKIIRIGPIIRTGFESKDNARPARRVLIMLSGSEFGSPVRLHQPQYRVQIDVIGRAAPDPSLLPAGVTFHGKVLDNRALITEADLLIVNGGFSAVSESFCMHKPMIVIPVPNHAEQWINARTIERLGVGMLASEDNLDRAMLEALNRIDEFRSAYKSLPTIEDGAALAAKVILERAKGAQRTALPIS